MGVLAGSGEAKLDLDTQLYRSAAVLLGFGLVANSVVLRLPMLSACRAPAGSVFHRRLSAFTLEHDLAAGACSFWGGSGAGASSSRCGGEQGFGDLDPVVVMGLAIPSVTAIALGLQVAFVALSLSLVKRPIRPRPTS